MFNAMSTVLKPYRDATSDIQEKLIETKLDALKDASQPMTFDKTVEMIKQTNELFGGHQSASEQDVQIAWLTVDTRLQEIQLNLDARKMAVEAKSENMKWQQIGGLLTTVTGIAGPTVANAMSAGARIYHINP